MGVCSRRTRPTGSGERGRKAQQGYTSGLFAGQDVFKILLIESGLVRRCSLSHRSGRFASGQKDSNVTGLVGSDK